MPQGGRGGQGQAEAPAARGEHVNEGHVKGGGHLKGELVYEGHLKEGTFAGGKGAGGTF